MKYLLQILFLLFSWFNLSATHPLPKVAFPNYSFSFPKTTNQNLESELEIGVCNFARSGIAENASDLKVILRKSSVLENRAHEGKAPALVGVLHQQAIGV